jgi:hypothetical protein
MIKGMGKQIYELLVCKVSERVREEKEWHQQGADTELERIRQEVKRKALGLLGTIGLTAEDLAVWQVK